MVVLAQEPNSIRIVNKSDDSVPLYYYLSKIDKRSKAYKNKQRILYISNKPRDELVKLCGRKNQIDTLYDDILDLELGEKREKKEEEEKKNKK